MKAKLKSEDIARFAAFAATLSVGTAGITGLDFRFAKRSNESETTVPEVARFFPSAFQMAAPGQRTASYGQRMGSIGSQMFGASTPLIVNVDQLFVSGVTLLRSVAALSDVLKWLRTSAMPLPMREASTISPAAAIGRRAFSVQESLGTIGEAAKVVVAAVVQIGARGLTATGVMTATLLGGAAVSLHNWNAFVKSVVRMTVSASHEAMASTGRFASAAVGETEKSDAEKPSVVDPASSARRGWGRLKQVTAELDSTAIGGRPVARQELTPLNYSQFCTHFDRGSATQRRLATVAMLSTSLLAAPVQATISDLRPRGETMGFSPVAIASNPTIVINTDQADDIEQRVLKALRQHGETIYAQWSRELQKRQRTQF